LPFRREVRECDSRRSVDFPYAARTLRDGVLPRQLSQRSERLPVLILLS
jgi:hypothetical protein